MRAYRSASGRYEIVEHDVYSVETGKVSYVMRSKKEITDSARDDECSQSPETSSSTPTHSQNG